MRTLHLILTLFIISIFYGCSFKNPKLLTYEQNEHLYVKSIEPLHVKSENFSSKYFMPCSIEKAKNIIKVTNFATYNSKLHYGLTVKNTQVRNLPTHKPFYKNPNLVGEGFAFEYLQNFNKTIISDLHLEENKNNVKKEMLLISKAKGLVIKPDMPTYAYHNLARMYPSIIKVQNNLVYFNDNSTLEYHDYKNRDFKSMINNPSIKNTLSLRYPAFEEIIAPNINFDPGRFKNEKLLKKLYGKNKADIQKNLLQVEWVDGSIILFNQKQNAALQLQKVSNDLKRLPRKYHKYLTNIAGTFNYRTIAGTTRLSTHSFGIAIDINIKNTHYWKWTKNLVYKNKIPKEIIDIFEKYGFIWGGRWYHYDTMHFEYRPELFDNID